MSEKRLYLVWNATHNKEGDRIADSNLWKEAWWTVGPSREFWTISLTWNVYGKDDDIEDQHWFDPPTIHATEEKARAWALQFESDHRDCATAAEAVERWAASA
jgi:hypothetical protein